MNKVGYKYKRGTVLYSINQERIFEKNICKTCAGDGELTNKLYETFACPLCDGTGGREMYKGLRWKVFKGIVRGIRINIDNMGTRIHYDMIVDRKANISDLWTETNVYDNLEIVTKECEDSNKSCEKYDVRHDKF